MTRTEAASAQMDKLLTIKNTTDRLAERVEIVAYYKREGIRCNPRKTA